MSRLNAVRDFKTRAASLLPVLALALLLAGFAPADAFAQSSVRPPDTAVSSEAGGPVGGSVPGDALGTTSDAEVWRAVRQGVSGTVSIPDSKAGVLVQSDGEDWRLMRNGPLYDYLGLAMIATLILLALFFAIRGRIRIEHGKAGVTIKRFSLIERTAHWLMALSFIVLALSGLNISFGRDLVMPLIGKEAFGPMSGFLKFTHNYVAFAFLLGLAVAFVLWVVHNIPNRHDLVWLAKGGGLFSKNVHPPSRKFNAGQKIIFWLVMIGGLSLGVSGWALLFPFEHAFFSDTFAALSSIGLDVPAWLGLPEPPYSVIQEQQYNSLWHAIVAVAMICLIFAHIYLGSVGMEGAFDAMGNGDVDLNWAKEHHSIWVEETLDEGKAPRGTTHAQPAE
ncbi:formate dehydrogenase subunit gamma [Oricola cellulosilytica]|uniref:Formate dehydrogenase subunit gamma n=1 Tax=Oricola cellulosilytica TaxID=1429082 RepID=A0A4R0P8M3_9HYPH|nr:formate dehydrogenase subunit gamma [Oricola cellulosilytica]TCD11916.1 formate dehydrogenase subunit gamma [Oricola cellulosilytica]